VIENYLTWQVKLKDPETILLASEIEERYLLSFWDSLIDAAARRGSANKILTEDLTTDKGLRESKLRTLS
jgi:predicted nucleic acid-binding protein